MPHSSPFPPHIQHLPLPEHVPQIILPSPPHTGQVPLPLQLEHLTFPVPPHVEHIIVPVPLHFEQVNFPAPPHTGHFIVTQLKSLLQNGHLVLCGCTCILQYGQIGKAYPDSTFHSTFFFGVHPLSKRKNKIMTMKR